jgi:hypothetical protein
MLERTLTISTPSAEAHGWHPDIGKNWHNTTPASGEYTITPEDGRVAAAHGWHPGIEKKLT